MLLAVPWKMPEGCGVVACFSDGDSTRNGAPYAKAVLGEEEFSEFVGFTASLSRLTGANGVCLSLQTLAGLPTKLRRCPLSAN